MNKQFPVAMQDFTELESFVDAFESAVRSFPGAVWQDFLPSNDHAMFSQVAAEIARIDLEMQWERGNRVLAHSYQEALPQAFGRSDLFADLLYEEFRQRHLAGENVDRDEYAKQYGIKTVSWPTTDTIARSGEATTPAGENDLSTLTSLEFALDSLDKSATIPDVGERFAGFELVRLLGEGAFARVFLARQSELANRPVALKIASDRSFEANRLARLQHTNIVPILSTHSAHGLHAVCMPYLGSVTLADVLTELRCKRPAHATGQDLLAAIVSNADAAQANRLKLAFGHLCNRSYVESVIWILSRVTEGLGYAHRTSIVHGDLKPANILLADDGEPRLFDFNLSSDIGAEQSTLVLAGGTLPYMSPQQLQFTLAGGAIQPTDDVYSLGIIAHELLTLERPFPHREGVFEDLIGTMIKDRHQPIGTDTVLPYTPRSVSALVGRCLYPKQENRYPDANELAEDLHCHLDSLPLKHAPDRSVLERVQKWVRRHPRLTSAGSVAALASAVLIAAALALVFRGRQVAALDARNTFHEFQSHSVLARSALSEVQFDSTVTAEALDNAQQAIDLYDVLEDEYWQEASRYRLLSEQQQTELDGRLVQILYLLAENSLTDARSDSLAMAHKLNAAARDLVNDDDSTALRIQADKLNGKNNETSTTFDATSTVTDQHLDSPNQFLNALAALRQGDYEGAYPQLRHLRDQNSLDPAIWLALGHACAGKDDYSEAEGCYSTFIGLLPASHLGYFYRGRSRLDKKELLGALADFDKAIELRPAFAAAWLNRGLVLREQRRYEQAIEAFSRAIDTGQASTRAYFLRSDCYKRVGEMEPARDDFQVGLSLTPNDEGGWVTRGVARISGDPDGALSDFNQALTTNPRSHRAWKNSVYVLIEVLDQKEEALSRLGNMLRLFPRDKTALAARGVLLARTGERELALRDVEALLVDDPSAKFVYQAATAFALTSREAPQDAERASRLLAQAFLRDPHLMNIADTDTDLDPIRDSKLYKAVTEAASILRDTSRIK